MRSKILFPLLLAIGLMGPALALGAAEASQSGSTVTTCETFQPYPGVTHQQCTIYYYDEDGVLLFTFVYYIDENGVRYLL